MDVKLCPSQQRLKQLFLGQLPDNESESLAQHLSGCPSCFRTLEKLHLDDTLVEAVRKGVPLARSAVQSVQQGLAERLQALAVQPPADLTAATVAAGSGSGAIKAASGVRAAAGASFAFLAPAQSADELGRLGPYRILKVLGQGGMGVVFLAEDVPLQRTVALKAMLPAIAQKADAKERFLREARAAANLEHDHIVAIHTVGEEAGVPYIAMPLLKGISLEDYLRQREAAQPGSTLTWSQIGKIGREIAKGLAAAHERGLIHRDIKPANIWLDASAGGRVKILDFGLARPSTGEQNLTQSGVIMGTPSYMAPEQARSERVDHRADLFSLGVVLYRLCTAKLPFQGQDALSTLMAVVTDAPPAPRQINPQVPPALSELVMKLLEKDPARRIGSAREVVQAIQAIEQQIKASGGQPSAVLPSESQTVVAPVGLVPVETPSKAKRKRRLLIAAGVLFVLVGGSVVLGQFILRITRPDGKTQEIPLESGTKLELVQQDKKPTPPENKEPKPPEKPAPPLPVKGSRPFDRFRREDIPEAKLRAAGRGDPKKAPKEIVAILGDSQSKAAIRGFALHPNGKILALGVHGADRVKMLDVATGEERVWPQAINRPQPICFSHDGKLLALGTNEYGPASLFDAVTGKQLQVLTDKATNFGVFLAFSPDDRQVFSLPSGQFLQRHWVSDRVELGTAPPPALEKANYAMSQMALSPDGNILAAASVTNYESCFVQLWDVGTGKLLGKISDKLRPAWVVFSPDSKLLAQAQMYRHDIAVFEVATRKQRGVFKAPNGDTQHLAFHPKGTVVATCDFYGDIYFFDTTTFANVRILRVKPPTSGNPYMGGIRRVQFTPDGRHLLTQNGDGTVYVLRLAAPPTSPPG